MVSYLRDDRKLRVSEIKIAKEIFATKRDEGTNFGYIAIHVEHLVLFGN
jgi:hypothetical protein